MRPCLTHPDGCGIDYSACISGALPFYAMVLQLAKCSCSTIFGAVVQEVTNGNEGQHDSYHRIPSFRLSLDIDSQIATQMLIGVLAFEIGFACIHMSFAVFIKVILSFIFGHGITSRSMVIRLLDVSFPFPKDTASSRGDNVNRSAVLW
jgi:hypothetical protein